MNAQNLVVVVACLLAVACGPAEVGSSGQPSAAKPPAAAVPASADTLSAAELDRRTIERRAVEAAIWGIPIVSVDAMRQGYFRDGKAKYGDIIWWPKGNTWKNQSLTPNTSVRYVYLFLNTKDMGGPVVLDVPSAPSGFSLLGTMGDAWQVPLTDVGFEGKGAKYLVLPPDYTGEVPSGYVPIRSKTYNTFTTLRSILPSTSEADVRKGDDLVKQLKIYPLAMASSPPTQRFVDMTDTMYDGLVRYDISLYTNLARMVNEEPVQPQDLQMMGMLRSLGIEKGKEFRPDAATTAQLNSAAAEAHASVLARMPTFVTTWWPASRWEVPVSPIAQGTGFMWQDANHFDVDSRALAMAGFFLPPAKLGSGSFYLGAYSDSTGQQLRGEHNYHLHIPKDVPVSQFWSVTVYDFERQTLYPNTRPSLDSLDKTMRRNSDGSVDMYFGPKAPAGQESNWIPTVAGKSWFPWFRFYGPEKALFDKRWKMPDIEKLK